MWVRLPSLPQRNMINNLVVFISSITAISSMVIAWFSYKTSHNSFLNEIHGLFFNIMCSYDNSTVGKIKHNLSISNFCEYLCGLLKKRQIKISDIDYYLPILKSKVFIDFVKNEIKKNPELFFYYSNWLKENKLW